MSDYSMADISSLLKSVGSSDKALNSTSRKNNTELDMTDFLQLMIVQLQSQTLDDTMDTSEMMNQMVQMQMISAITNMTETSIMSYASSLVGKEVTIGIVNGDELEERVVTVTGTAMSNGQQIIFGQDEDGNIESYTLNQIMAVGTLPPLDKEDAPSDSTQNPGTAPVVPGGNTQEPGGSTQQPDGETVDPGEDIEQPGTGPSLPGESTEQPTQPQDPEYDGTQGAPSDT